MIIHIDGSGKEALVIANAIRNSQIGQGKGALLLTPDNIKGAEPRFMLEKIIASEKPLVELEKAAGAPIPAGKLKWKNEAIVVAVGDAIDVLGEFDKLAPGFIEQFGPVSKVTLSTAVK